MNTWTASLSSVIIFAACLYIPIGLMTLYLGFLSRRHREKHISPLTNGFLREAGHGLRLKYEDKMSTVHVHAIAMFIFSMFPFVVEGVYSLYGKSSSLRLTLSIALAIILYTIWKMGKIFPEVKNLRLGLEAEIACGQLLSQLMRHGWYVYHDIPSPKINGKFNIDHILIGPPGVYVVETKGRSKSLSKTGGKQSKIFFKNNRLEFPNNKHETKPLEQAQANARHIAEWLPRASGVKFTPEPVLLFPGWYFEAKEKPPFPLIGNPKLIVDTLKNKSQAILSPEQCEQIAFQVEQAVRLTNYMDGDN